MKIYFFLGDVVDKWPMMDGPGLITGIVLTYLLFVLKVGPDFMKHRKPMDLKRTLIFYNGTQVLFSIFLIFKVIRIKYFFPYKSHWIM